MDIPERDLPYAGGDGPVTVRHFAGHLDHVERLNGQLRVAHLTDLHFGRVTPHEVQKRAVAETNEANPDVVVLTGDFVAHSLDYLDSLEEVLAQLEAPAFATLGNHDYWSGPDDVRRSLRRVGIEVLDNANTTLRVRGERLQILGLDDAYTGHHDRDRAIRGLDPRLPTIGLSHIGEEADRLWPAGVPLVFSGHTHGGQITLARLHELAVGRLSGHRYIHGLYGQRRPAGVVDDDPPGAVYVSAGIGASVMPVRLGDRGQRELALFELGVEPGAFVEHHSEQVPLEGRPPSEATQRRRKKKVLARAARRARRAARSSGPSPKAPGPDS